ncbi:MAG: hypothetical protein KY457_11050 [Actinobacteria bacterium]|nr:hypothetical protein [Actinomycetota bacterium]
MRASEVWSVTWRGALIVVLVWIFALGTFLVGLGSLPFAWVLAPLAVAAVAVALVRAAWRGRPGRDVATTVAAVLAAAVGLLVWGGSPPGHLLVSWHLDDVELPADARFAGEHRSGNTWCFDTCPTISRTYRVPGEPRAVADDMHEALRRAGLHVTRRDASGVSFSDGPAGDVNLTVDIAPATDRAAPEDHPDPELVAGVTEITVTARARQRW